MFAVGLCVGLVTGASGAIFMAVVAYRMAQLHAAEKEDD